VLHIGTEGKVSGGGGSEKEGCDECDERSENLKVISCVGMVACCYCFRFAPAVLRSSLDFTFLIDLSLTPSALSPCSTLPLDLRLVTFTHPATSRRQWT